MRYLISNMAVPKKITDNKYDYNIDNKAKGRRGTEEEKL